MPLLFRQKMAQNRGAVATTRYSFRTRSTTQPAELDAFASSDSPRQVVLLCSCRKSISGRRQAPPRTMDARWRQAIYKIMIVFSNHSMVLFGAWLLPDTCLVKLTTTAMDSASKLRWNTLLADCKESSIALSGLTGDCIKK